VHFQPDKWKPTLPNPAFDQAQPDDLFWAAERVMAFSDDAIRAAVAEARFSDSAAAEYLAQVLIARRDRIGRAFMTPLNPIGQPAIDRRGELTFRNAAVDAGVADEARAYELRWLVFDNGAGTSTLLTRWASEGRSASTLPPVPASAEYIAVDIRAIHPHFPAWAAPVKATFRRGADGAWTTVGFERLERGN
jgi:hypothetical protein